jgi:hypothetical protein
MPGFTEIPNYEREDEGWGVVIGPFIRPPAKEDDSSSTDSQSQPSEREDE